MEGHAGKYRGADQPEGLGRDDREAFRVHALAWESTLRTSGYLPSAERPLKPPDSVAIGSRVVRLGLGIRRS